MNATAYLWLPVLIVLAIHQLEEVVLDMHAWKEHRVLPRWSRWLQNAIMFKLGRWWQRALVVVAQAVLFFGALWLINGNLAATRIYLTLLVAAWTLAFAGHLALSRATRSWMPGVYTSILPGIPAGLVLLWWIWR